MCVCGIALNVVNNSKYLGHIISSVNDDSQDIAQQMSLLYARANMLIQKFSKCSRDVKLCLFRAYRTQFYGAELWKCFLASVLQHSEAAYVKCDKMLFSFAFAQTVSVTAIFCELRLPTFKTKVHNVKVKMESWLKVHSNILIRSVCSAVCV